MEVLAGPRRRHDAEASRGFRRSNLARLQCGGDLEVLLFSPVLRKGTRMSAFARYHRLKGRRIVRVRAENAATRIGDFGKPGNRCTYNVEAERVPPSKGWCGTIDL
jgi:hypothetical protein